MIKLSMNQRIWYDLVFVFAARLESNQKSVKSRLFLSIIAFFVVFWDHRRRLLVFFKLCQTFWWSGRIRAITERRFVSFWTFSLAFFCGFHPRHFKGLGLSKFNLRLLSFKSLSLDCSLPFKLQLLKLLLIDARSLLIHANQCFLKLLQRKRALDCRHKSIFVSFDRLIGMTVLEK